jgi:hypothetical protein
MAFVCFYIALCPFLARWEFPLGFRMPERGKKAESRKASFIEAENKVAYGLDRPKDPLGLWERSGKGLGILESPLKKTGLACRKRLRKKREPNRNGRLSP